MEIGKGAMITTTKPWILPGSIRLLTVFLDLSHNQLPLSMKARISTKVESQQKLYYMAFTKIAMDIFYYKCRCSAKQSSILTRSTLKLSIGLPMENLSFLKLKDLSVSESSH